MPFDANERRREQNAFGGQQVDRRQLEVGRREATSTTHESLFKGHVSAGSQALGIVSASLEEVKARLVPSASDLFCGHVRKLVSHLNFLWHDMLPVELIDAWRLKISLLDVDKPAQSLEILFALRESFLKAKAACQPNCADQSQAMRFEEKVPRIGHEIDKLIAMLSQVRT